jgi:hypothetical protein
VKQHFTANGPEREFARDVRAQILGVMGLLLGPALQVMAGDEVAPSSPEHPLFKIFLGQSEMLL